MSVSIKITGLKELERNINKTIKSIAKTARKPIRKALNAGAKELEKTIKPTVPILKTSTNFRQKGTLKNNIRHKTRVAKMD